MRIYTETPFRLAPPRMAVVHPEIGTASSLLEAQRGAYDRDVALMRHGMPRELLPNFWRQVLENLATKEARTEAMRPSIGKPLSRRARRRNRGRVRVAKNALMRRFTPSMEWSWNKRDAA
ncbi:hypothetical protein MKK70_01290 [Methylobacterium sp. E-041]|jgi:hypothetical protein|uniref:hypothetical protein n=1 Tax=unclassified Methylobacterium TaxID=2615210 RepID=UPI0011CB8FE9|nr:MULTISPECIES: hypothetical protein [unclassified Methylobacterium]RZK94263.1 MAG: hypothetical protein EOO66_08530 [Methylobacterium sp.]MCJ2020971.1 hypothetical protein [Methylobacterium sp. E-065]MCJ2076096.1 hypothetical protein [Methylobacterium sp. E-016]MCJ2104039.1 hypothetical protein [Methylobacterium sp. E-041]MCJ2117313.1 hypothetical protein [Methylobacterium sp. J-001]